MDIEESSNHRGIPMLRYEAATELIVAVIGANNRGKLTKHTSSNKVIPTNSVLVRVKTATCSAVMSKRVVFSEAVSSSWSSK